MFIKELTLRNFRGFDSCYTTFNEKTNVIIGKNGAGKSSVLDAAAINLGGFLRSIPKLSIPNIAPTDIPRKIHREGYLSRIEHQLPSEICCVVSYGESDYECKRGKNNPSTTYTILTPDDTTSKLQNFLSSPHSILPLISYQNPYWTVFNNKLNQKKINGEMQFPRESGYIDCLNHTVNKERILSWVLSMEEKEGRGEGAPEYDWFKAAASDFMTTMENKSGKYEFIFNSTLKTLLYNQNGKLQQLTSLSSGYQSIVWMILDLTYRAAILNPHLGDRIGQIQGVVLVDNPETHLHPDLLWRLVGAFRRVFPAVQLIIATNSPVVICSVKDGCLIDINDIHDISYSRSAFGFTVDNVLKSVQRTMNVPEDINALQCWFSKAIDEDDMESAHKILRMMESLTGESPVLTGMRTEYELEKGLKD